MQNYKIENANRQIKSVTYLSVITNIVLFVIKMLVGLLSGSLALIADGIHSISDLATDVAVLMGIRFGSKKPDSEHPYGHGWAETFSAGFIALVLIVVGAVMIYYASVAIAQNRVTVPRFAVLIAAAVSIVAKEWLYRVTRKTAIVSHSSALYANAWHHRSDALSSVAVVIGFISLKFAFEHGDQVAAVVVGLMIVWVGVKVIGNSLGELTEAAVDSGTIEHIEKIIDNDSSIRHWHNLRTRTVGREVFLDLHILVDPHLTITAAHEIAERLENALHEQLARPVNIVVHVEPDKSEFRK